ncbi:hypothetical protein [Streptomyces sp. 7N604]|uniref:hypothetical protein n=1 Tax=Streptomyces sp. 7N604 TaxID=3457415 RepID=UPI003FD2BF14
MAPKTAERRWDLLLVITGTPHQDDMATTALRLAQAVLDEGGTVRVWACGYATMLTQTALGDTKPRNVRRPDRDYPSSAGIIRRMLVAGSGRFAWIGCTACSAERGATSHMPEVRLRSPMRFVPTIEAAVKTVYIGGI